MSSDSIPQITKTLIVLEDDIPIPVRYKAVRVYEELGTMQVGQSFKVPRAETKSLRNAAYRNHPTKDYKTRSEGEFIRIWRTK